MPMRLADDAIAVPSKLPLGPSRSSNVRPAHPNASHQRWRPASIPIERAAPARPTSRDFVPWRFSDAGPSAWPDHRWPASEKPAHVRRFAIMSSEARSLAANRDDSRQLEVAEDGRGSITAVAAIVRSIDSPSLPNVHSPRRIFTASHTQLKQPDRRLQQKINHHKRVAITSPWTASQQFSIIHC